jgi:hypothetical protein
MDELSQILERRITIAARPETVFPRTDRRSPAGRPNERVERSRAGSTSTTSPPTGTSRAWSVSGKADERSRLDSGRQYLQLVRSAPGGALSVIRWTILGANIWWYRRREA